MLKQENHVIIVQGSNCLLLIFITEINMKTLKNSMVNFRMIFTNYGFYICIAFTAVLCFCTAIYHDPTNNNEYSAIKSLMEFDHEFMLNNTLFCSYSVASKGAGSWMTMFIPIISAFAFIPLVCDRCESKFVRLSVFRSSKLSHRTAEFLTACISGGLAVMLGYLLFIGLVYILFPNINEYSPDLQAMLSEELSYVYPEALKHGHAYLLAMQSFEIFLYGTVSAVPSVMLTCLIRNKYLVMCIPFFLKYAVTQTSVKLSARAFSDWQNPDMKLSEFAAIISPDAILNSFSSPLMWQIILYNGVLVFVAFLFYIIVYGRRLDCGE